MNNKMVSVCIPVYGVEKYIERCARSLFEQTMTDGIEFIFVNDCTNDRSIEILEQILSEYPQRKNQVKIIHHDTNQGLTGARNTALKYAQGEYIIHCDSDDWVDIKMYENMYNKAIETDADMVYCDYKLESSKTQNVCLKSTLSAVAMLKGVLDTSIHGSPHLKYKKISVPKCDSNPTFLLLHSNIPETFRNLPGQLDEPKLL